MHPARAMWQRYETLHAVVYFAREVADAMVDVGLKGFWMGYFAGRSAPFGEAGPELVTATFYNFHPAMPARALPDAWSFASPADVLAARYSALDATLRRLLGDLADGAAIDEAVQLADTATEGCSPQGRALFAAHLSLDRPTAPHLRLWHAATLLREHRGDGHVAALLAAGLDGLEAHVTAVASGTVDAARMRASRGWSEEDWQAAVDRLAERGLLDRSGALTPRGTALRAEVEATTERLALEPWEHLGPDGTQRLGELLDPIARRIVDSGVLPYPNPIGLPRAG